MDKHTRYGLDEIEKDKKQIKEAVACFTLKGKVDNNRELIL